MVAVSARNGRSYKTTVSYRRFSQISLFISSTQKAAEIKCGQAISQLRQDLVSGTTGIFAECMSIKFCYRLTASFRIANLRCYARLYLSINWGIVLVLCYEKLICSLYKMIWSTLQPGIFSQYIATARQVISCQTNWRRH